MSGGESCMRDWSSHSRSNFPCCVRWGNTILTMRWTSKFCPEVGQKTFVRFSAFARFCQTCQILSDQIRFLGGGGRKRAKIQMLQTCETLEMIWQGNQEKHFRGVCFWDAESPQTSRHSSVQFSSGHFDSFVFAHLLSAADVELKSWVISTLLYKNSTENPLRGGVKF